MQQLLLIGGAQRSGTTLLQLLLCQAEESNEMLREASYLRGLLRTYRESARTKEISSYFSTPLEFQAFHAELTARFIHQASTHLGSPKCLVLKDPYFSIYTGEVLQLLPSARLLCMVRDPRDTLASMVEVNKRSVELYNKLIFPNDLRKLCEHFLTFYAPFFSTEFAPHKERVSFIRYEDLLQKTEDTLAILEGVTGLTLRSIELEGNLESGHVDYEEDKDISPWWSKHYGKELSTDSIGRYKTIFSREQIAAINTFCSPLLTRFGYEVPENA